MRRRNRAVVDRGCHQSCDRSMQKGLRCGEVPYIRPVSAQQYKVRLDVSEALAYMPNSGCNFLSWVVRPVRGLRGSYHMTAALKWFTSCNNKSHNPTLAGTYQTLHS
jgi:hypothetical protein